MAQVAKRQARIAVDPLWSRIWSEADQASAAEPALAGLFHAAVLVHDSFEAALTARLVSRLDDEAFPTEILREAILAAHRADPGLGELARIDLQAVLERDPAAARAIEPLLFFKGYHGIQTYRVARHHWTGGRRDVAQLLRSRATAVFHIDIHPAATLGRAIFVDHATGVVVGETASIGDNVSILQGVTIGDSGTGPGRRHPRIGDDVLIGAGAQIVGPVTVGAASRIGAGSTVLADVPSGVTVAGVPARVVGLAGSLRPSSAMDQMLYDVGL